jgi:hypothetical protein
VYSALRAVIVDAAVPEECEAQVGVVADASEAGVGAVGCLLRSVRAKVGRVSGFEVSTPISPSLSCSFIGLDGSAEGTPVRMLCSYHSRHTAARSAERAYRQRFGSDRACARPVEANSLRLLRSQHPHTTGQIRCRAMVNQLLASLRFCESLELSSGTTSALKRSSNGQSCSSVNPGLLARPSGEAEGDDVFHRCDSRCAYPPPPA